MSFELLPAELQLEIFSHLENSDLKAARAVSRKLRDNASPALFRSAVACARYVAMGSFHNIALHPVLQKYVKEIVFDGSVYNSRAASREDWFQEENNRYDDLRTSSFWGLRTRWKRYNELYKEQEDLKASGVLLQSIARALEWTTNLSSIVYSPHPHLIPSEAKLMRDLLPRDYQSPSVTYFGMNGPDSAPHHQQHPFRLLIGALYFSKYSGICELRIEPFDDTRPGMPFTFDFFDFRDPSDIQAGRWLFQNLVKCELDFHILAGADETSVWLDRDNERGKLAHLSHLLSVSDDLQHLSLRIVGWSPLQDSAPQMELGPAHPVYSRLGLRKTWPKLQSFNLGGVHSTGDDVLDFIRRHGDTLRSLSFEGCSLYSGTWADIVDEVVYSTSICRFTLSFVNETHIPDGAGSVQRSEGLEEWKYEGSLEVSLGGDRKFVDANPAKKSVYDRAM